MKPKISIETSRAPIDPVSPPPWYNQRMPRDLEIQLAGQSAVLMPERTLHLPELDLLLAADLHLGKAETYRSLGVAMPEGIAEESLERLEGAINRCGAGRVTILGDLVHCEEGMEDPIVDLFARWRRRMTTPISLIGGNHDADVSIPRSWGIDDDGDQRRTGPFLLRHHPRPSGDEIAEDAPFLLAGHLHPVLSLGEGARRVLAHAFLLDLRQMVLPAFTPFARGARVHSDPDRDRQVFVIAEGQVVAT